MPTPRGIRSSLPRSLGRALVLLAISALVLGTVHLALVLPGAGDARWVHLLFIVVFWVYVAAGLVAWWRRPSNRMGALIVIGGLALFAGSLADTTVPVLPVIGTITATAVLAVAFHLLHAFPSGRLRSRASRVTVAAGYGVALVLQAPLYLFDPGAPAPLSVADRPDLLMLGSTVQRACGIAVAVATTAILARRLIRSDAAHRRVLGPLFAYGIVAVILIPASASLFEAVLGMPALVRAAVQAVLLGGIPVAFALGVLRGGFARTGELEELGTWLGTTGGARPSLTAALRHALGDASLDIVFWVPDSRTWVDAAGARVGLPTAGDERSSVEVEVGGRTVGAIVYDASLLADPDPVRTAGRVVAIAVERERLTAELLASQDALRASRARLVATADRERRRIAQNLHDGLQVQLVLLALEAQQVANAPGSTPDTREQATSLRKGIDDAAADLRRLVHDVMPSTLIEQGLSAATEDLVDRIPVPTRLHLGITDGALPGAIESTAYFVVAEGLANALKHSRAGAFTVRIERRGDRLLVEVHDDGVGGASFTAGRGLRGLADRVEVVNGRLEMQSALGHGTRLSAELPCVL
ncbi:sensor histidine kinase [Arthrobacter agilis]|jgi:signal transduction histidine kinase|uniref:sensor histidine kinase n=1 Tax=Arthrobacter agilis TaxID=37921 RepID=UPI00278445A4|nr:histidine kinase [Arthrobacter agilis]MDQ0735689.1 signal transduction histidine kinase [Arthrobacter agilis]